jgi:hypothetical protein
MVSRDIIESQIKNWLGLTQNKIFARKCYIKEIKDSKVAVNFLEENHIQGGVVSILKLGLYHEGDLVSLMTFNQYEGRNKMEPGGWNINRFCNKVNLMLLVGHLNYLNISLKIMMLRELSYSDRDWSLGGLYKALGFKNISEGGPDYKYVYEGVRTHKSRFRKSRLNTDLSESEYMKKSQIHRIWDCGKVKWEFTKNLGE